MKVDMNNQAVCFTRTMRGVVSHFSIVTLLWNSISFGRKPAMKLHFSVSCNIYYMLFFCTTSAAEHPQIGVRLPHWPLCLSHYHRKDSSRTPLMMSV